MGRQDSEKLNQDGSLFTNSTESGGQVPSTFCRLLDCWQLRLFFPPKIRRVFFKERERTQEKITTNTNTWDYLQRLAWSMRVKFFWISSDELCPQILQSPWERARVCVCVCVRLYLLHSIISALQNLVSHLRRVFNRVTHLKHTSSKMEFEKNRGNAGSRRKLQIIDNYDHHRI